MRNPTKKQLVHEGEVTGFTKNGYIRFDLDDGTKTCKARENLVHISKGKNGDRQGNRKRV